MGRILAWGEFLTSECLQLQPDIPRSYGLEDFRALNLLDDRGRIRLLPAQRYFENQDDYGLLPDLFDAWRNHDEYMLFKHRTDEKTEILALKCAKRGNDVYNSRIWRRFRLFRKNMPNQKFFSLADLALDKKATTSMLWVTLTWNPRRSRSVRSAWKTDLGKDWNRAISAIRRRYGKVDVIRAWEKTRNGFPHIHGILWFEKAKFTVFPWFSGSGHNAQKTSGASEGTLPPLPEKHAKLTYRIEEKAEFEGYWHSLVDIQALSSMKQAINYMMKYQLKIHGGQDVDPAAAGSTEAASTSEASKTLAFMWLFRKRSYSCSRGFQTRFSDLIRTLHNSNMDFGKDKTESWEFLGVFSGKDLGLRGEWVAMVDPVRLTGLLPDGDPRVDQGCINMGDLD